MPLDATAKLAAVALTGYQSYRKPVKVAFEDDLTVVAGRNDVGKSALLRAMRVFSDQLEGVRPDFEITFHWRFPTSVFLEAAEAKGLQAPGHPDWLAGRDEHTLAVTFKPEKPPEGERGQIPGGHLSVAKLELIEAGHETTSVGAGVQPGWTSGPFNGTATLVSEFGALASNAARRIAYLAPRRIIPGPRTTRANEVLTPTGENLTEVVYDLQTNNPRVKFPRLERFLQLAFPQIETVTASPSREGQNASELHVIYKADLELRVPLSQCGTGIEQMLALGAAILTQPEPRTFLIDEPQAYLHPHAERSLKAFLAEYPQHQYVIASHSGVFLTSQPLRKTKLVTMSGGASTVVEPDEQTAILEELGVTPADLWLAERLLWVEGDTDVGIFEDLIGEADDPEVETIRVRAMPYPSRFSQTTRGAERTFKFVGTVTEAVAPMPIKMLFLFDTDEKSDETKEAIKRESQDRARFLPVREIENLLLHADSIHEQLSTVAEQFELALPSLEDVTAAVAEELAKHNDKDLYPLDLEEGQNEETVVKGSTVLQKLWDRFVLGHYAKAHDGRALAAIVRRRAPERLEPAREILRELATLGRMSEETKPAA